MRADHAKTKYYCMTRFFGHGQSILQVFETPIALSMVKSVKSQFFQTLLVPISWTLAICNTYCSHTPYNEYDFIVSFEIHLVKFKVAIVYDKIVDGTILQ